MKQTVIEKIISRHSDRDVKSGEIVWMNLDIRSARDFGGANVVKNFENSYAGETVENAKKTFFTFDTNLMQTINKHAVYLQASME
jgi:3-isopropylmalate/(R)-2-methylmalate dehydratase large subunit